jgi:hypothetical protein
VSARVNYLRRKVFFTKNNVLVGCIPCNLENTLDPTIGFWDKNVTMDAYFSQKLPKLLIVICSIRTQKMVVGT